MSESLVSLSGWLSRLVDEDEDSKHVDDDSDSDLVRLDEETDDHLDDWVEADIPNRRCSMNGSWNCDDGKRGGV